MSEVVVSDSILNSVKQFCGAILIMMSLIRTL